MVIDIINAVLMAVLWFASLGAAVYVVIYMMFRPTTAKQKTAGAVLVASAAVYVPTFSLWAYGTVLVGGILIIGLVFGFKTNTEAKDD
jgi:hypothetical protein